MQWVYQSINTENSSKSGISVFKQQQQKRLYLSGSSIVHMGQLIILFCPEVFLIKCLGGSTFPYVNI